MGEVVLRPPPIPRPGRKGRIILRLILAVPVIFIGWRVYVHFALAAKLKAVRKSGYPVNAVELEQKYYSPIPKGENVALAYLEALKDLESTNGFRSSVPLWTSSSLPPRSIIFSVENRAKIGAYLARNRGVLESLCQVSATNKARYPMDFGKGMLIDKGPHVKKVGDGVRLLLLAAVYESESGSLDKAMAEMAAASRLCSSVKEEPFLVSQMALVGWRKMLFTTFQQVLEGKELTAPQLLAFSDAFGGTEAADGLERALAGERCFGIWALQRPLEEWGARPVGNLPEATDKQKAGRLLFQLSGFMDRECVYYLWMMENEVAFSRMPVPAMFPAVEKLEEDNFRTAKRNGHWLAGVMMPAYQRTFPAKVDDMVRSKIIKTVTAAELFRLAHDHKLPDSLEALTPTFLETAVMQDPYAGKTLRFKPVGKGYLVYSIGHDGKDDEGKEQGDRPIDGGDIVFRVER